MKSVLFLCTGNYYRSRFAEELFNHRARRARLAWHASSRALAIERGSGNVGPMSEHAAKGLGRLGVQIAEPGRMPQPCLPTDLSAASLIVALEEREHRPLLVERFSGWEDVIRYWHIRDVEFESPVVSLGRLAGLVDELVGELSAADPVGFDV